MTYDANCRAGKSIYKLFIGLGMCIGLTQNEVNRFTTKIRAHARKGCEPGARMLSILRTLPHTQAVARRGA